MFERQPAVLSRRHEAWPVAPGGVHERQRLAPQNLPLRDQLNERIMQRADLVRRHLGFKHCDGLGQVCQPPALVPQIQELHSQLCDLVLAGTRPPHVGPHVRQGFALPLEAQMS